MRACCVSSLSLCDLTYPSTLHSRVTALATMDRELARRGSGSSDQSHVKLKKELGLLEGVAVILGIIIGSGT